MSRRHGTIALVLLLLTAPAARADEPTPAWAPGARTAADIASWSGAASSIALDTLASWRAADRGRAFRHQALRLGATVAVSEVLKRVIHRDRPDGSDRLSLPSEHAAVTAASGGWNVNVSIPLTDAVGYLRMAANKHHPTDVAAGAAIGGIFAWLFR